MMESPENIDRYFKEKLENFKENPPQDTWDKIAIRLGHSRKRRMVIFISRIAAGITILISLSILFHYIQKDKNVELAHQSDPSTEIKPGDTKINSAQIIERETSQEKNGLPETVVTAKTIQKRSAISKITDNQADEQTTQSLHILADDVLQTGSDVKYKASDYYISVPDKISYLMPIECKYLDVDYSGDDQVFIAREWRIKGQARELSDAQLLAFTDEQPDEKERQTEWLLGGQFAPLYSYRNLASEQYQEYVKNQINSKESGIIAYAGGINLTVSPNRRLSVQSGIYYSKYGQEKNSLEYAAFLFPNQNTDATFYAIGDPKSEVSSLSVYIGNSTGKIFSGDEGLFNTNRSPIENQLTDQTEANQLNSTLPVKSVTQYFKYLEIPVNIKYKVLDKKFDVSLMGGISTNFLVGTDIQLNYTDNSSKNTDYTTEGLNRINYSGLIGIGFEYPLIKNLILNVEPKFRYYINPIDKEQVYDIHPYSIGIFSGISYLF